jgi:hypothetical protein
MRPHPGCAVEKVYAEDNPRDSAMRALRVDTYGINALLIVLRRLMSCGLRYDDGNTEIDRAFLQCCLDAEMGWQRDKDWELKDRLSKALKKENVTLKGMSFLEICELGLFRHFFKSNINFDLLGKCSFVKTGLHSLWELKRVDHDETLEKMLEWDGSAPLAQRIDLLWLRCKDKDGIGMELQRVSACPMFIPVK